MKFYLILSFFILTNCFQGFTQQLSNAKYQKIILMDGDKSGTLQIFADPTHFDCECSDVISAILIKTSNPKIYKSADNIIKLEIKGNKHIITINGKTDCCFIKPGTYD